MGAKIECAKAQKLIQPYLDDELKTRACAEFIAHIRECETCRHELETSFIVEYALKYLDDDKMDNFDIQGLLEEQIIRSERRMQRRQVLSVLMWTAIILMAVLIAGILIRLFLPDLFEDAAHLVSRLH